VRQRTASVFLHLRHPNVPSPSVFTNSLGIEATGSMHWFLELLGKLGIDHQVGRPSEIGQAEPRKQKYDRRDAALLLKLQVENRLPSIWMPSTELRDLRTLLKHRHQWVRLGGLSKQGNPLLRFLWCEAAVHAVRRDPKLQRFYRHKLAQKGWAKARAATAHELGIRWWIMLRDQIDYQEFCRRGQMRQKNGGACAGMPKVGHSPATQ
jgi:transposase